MDVTYIHHSGFLVETQRFYYLFDYETGILPPMDVKKPIFVLSSHSHADHCNPEVFPLLSGLGMEKIRAILSDDIEIPEGVDGLQVSPEAEYDLGDQLKLTTFRSTDLGVAFLIQDQDALIYHAGDLNDWVWDEESDYDRGLCYFLEHIPANRVYPMHYWDDPAIIETFLKDHPEFTPQIQKTE